MPLVLRTADDLPAPDAFGDWASLADGGASVLDPGRRRADLAADLEAAFEAIVDNWWHLGNRLAAEPSGELAHAPTCTPNASDMGLMMAWARLAGRWATEQTTTLLVCDDPWLFRHLAGKPGVKAGRPPPLVLKSIMLALRGGASRSAVALRVGLSFPALFRQRLRIGKGEAFLLVYGHPRATADGYDGYFADIMRRWPHLKRMLHVDCPLGRARALAADGRTFSLHAWGSLGQALLLPFAKWRPSAKERNGEWGWLVRRAAALEGGTGQAAEIRWQVGCQARWLLRRRPRIIAWPWENHSWERPLVRRARELGIQTVGYQHSVVGRLMIHYAAACNPDGNDSLPDHILTVGPAYQDQLAQWGIPKERLAVGGALRFAEPGKVALDPSAPVFLALPFDGLTAAEMVAAAKATGRTFVVKDHPMTPFRFAETDKVRRTDKRLDEQKAVSAVVYAATTVGLEALLMGLPVARFRPRWRLAIDVLPAAIEVAVVDGETMDEGLAALRASEPLAREMVARERVFADPDYGLWSELLK